MVDGGDRARDEFLSEAQEIVEGLGRDLLALDEGVRAERIDPTLINDVFRAVHTVKGLAGLFGATKMASLSHELEDLLHQLRLGQVELTASTLDILFRSVELYGAILQMEKEGVDQPLPQVDELIRELHRSAGRAAETPTSEDVYDIDPSLLAVLTEYEEHRLRTNIAQGLGLYRLRVQFQLATIDQALDELKAKAKPHGEIITYLPTGEGADADSIELDILMASGSSLAELSLVLGGGGVELQEIPRRVERASGTNPAALPPPKPTPSDRVVSGPSAPSVSILPPSRNDGPASIGIKAGAEVGTIRSVAQTVRVDIHKLDRLMNIVGELSLVRTSLAHIVERLRTEHGNREITSDLHRLQRTLDRRVGDMQQGILEVRMVPLGQVFDKLARVVRQISREADKLVNLVITGAETEVDKLIVEELSDPLMHMMRNAIDHGIEKRAEREAVGKPAVGTIALNAFQKGNHVVIEIEDDGRGIDTHKLLDKAMRGGLMGVEEAHGIGRAELLNLVFIPGLSTKEDVSELSGRGVGMDVVKTNISKLGGVIDLQSEPGIGTKMTVTLPITLAIISALIVRIAGRLFAIPLANVQEAVPLDPAAVRTIDGREVITLRGSTLQLCRLARLFGLDELGETELTPSEWSSPISAGSRPSRAASLGGKNRQFIVVTAAGAKRLGLVVGTLLGEEDIVIKTLGPSLKGVKGIAGASPLADQQIALVIDAPALVEELHIQGERGRPALEQRGGYG